MADNDISTAIAKYDGRNKGWTRDIAENAYSRPLAWLLAPVVLALAIFDTKGATNFLNNNFTTRSKLKESGEKVQKMRIYDALITDLEGSGSITAAEAESYREVGFFVNYDGSLADEARVLGAMKIHQKELKKKLGSKAYKAAVAKAHACVSPKPPKPDPKVDQGPAAGVAASEITLASPSGAEPAAAVAGGHASLKVEHAAGAGGSVGSPEERKRMRPFATTPHTHVRARFKGKGPRTLKI